MPFSALGLPEPILKGVRAAGYSRPTPIQQEAIPIILPGHDLIAAAQTGSGKTAAFILPILAKLLRGHHALRALVLVPTRELAAQIEESARTYARFASLHVGAVFGGVPIPPQERMLRQQGVDLLVATPGRLLDLHGRQSLALDDIEILVLDEADRMVDMGFAPDLRRILRLLPDDRQTLMFSATMPRELNTVAKEALEHPKRIEIKSTAQTAPDIAQKIYAVPHHLKLDLLDALLVKAGKVRAIVFARTKRSADRLASRLSKRGHAVAVLHGDREQRQRERALLDFKRGRARVLVATDIASRGIDVDHVTHVVNFEAPRAPEDYVHRIGRTGRMEASGEAITLVSPEEREQIDAIERFLGRKVERLTLSGFDYKRRGERETSAGDSERPSRRGGRRREEEAPRGRRSASSQGTSRSSGSHGSTTSRATSGSHAGAKSSHGASASHGTSASQGTSAEPSHGRRRRIQSTDRRSRRRM